MPVERFLTSPVPANMPVFPTQYTMYFARGTDHSCVASNQRAVLCRGFLEHDRACFINQIQAGHGFKGRGKPPIHTGFGEGPDFSRAAKSSKSARALAPDGSASGPKGIYETRAISSFRFWPRCLSTRRCG